MAKVNAIVQRRRQSSSVTSELALELLENEQAVAAEEERLRKLEAEQPLKVKLVGALRQAKLHRGKNRSDEMFRTFDADGVPREGTL